MVPMSCPSRERDFSSTVRDWGIPRWEKSSLGDVPNLGFRVILKTNITPEKIWLEDYFPFETCAFSGDMFFSGGSVKQKKKRLCFICNYLFVFLLFF